MSRTSLFLFENHVHTKPVTRNKGFTLRRVTIAVYRFIRPRDNVFHDVINALGTAAIIYEYITTIIWTAIKKYRRYVYLNCVFVLLYYVRTERIHGHNVTNVYMLTVFYTIDLITKWPALSIKNTGTTCDEQK